MGLKVMPIVQIVILVEMEVLEVVEVVLMVLVEHLLKVLLMEWLTVIMAQTGQVPEAVVVVLAPNPLLMDLEVLANIF